MKIKLITALILLLSSTAFANPNSACTISLYTNITQDLGNHSYFSNGPQKLAHQGKLYEYLIVNALPENGFDSSPYKNIKFSLIKGIFEFKGTKNITLENGQGVTAAVLQQCARKRFPLSNASIRTKLVHEIGRNLEKDQAGIEAAIFSVFKSEGYDTKNLEVVYGASSISNVDPLRVRSIIDKNKYSDPKAKLEDKNKCINSGFIWSDDADDISNIQCKHSITIYPSETGYAVTSVPYSDIQDLKKLQSEDKKIGEEEMAREKLLKEKIALWKKRKFEKTAKAESEKENKRMEVQNKKSKKLNSMFE